VTTLESDDVEVVWFQSEADASACALSPRVEVRLLIWPTAEISVLIVEAALCSSVSGLLSTAISDEMMLVTSRPEPTPMEVTEPVMGWILRGTRTFLRRFHAGT